MVELGFRSSIADCSALLGERTGEQARTALEPCMLTTEMCQRLWELSSFIPVVGRIVSPQKISLKSLYL